MSANKKSAKKTATKAVKKATPKSAAKKTAAKAAPKKAAKRKGHKAPLANAAAILGFKPAPKKSSSTYRPMEGVKIKAEWKKYYDVLMDLRDHLLHQMGDIKKESAEEMSGYSMHMADSGTDNFDRDSALSLLSYDQDAVYEIEEALKRIERQTFGTCEISGKTIPKGRLNAIPWARYTVDAQAQLEKNGAVRQRKLGSLGTIDGAGTNSITVPDEVGSEPKPAKSSKSAKAAKSKK